MNLKKFVKELEKEVNKYYDHNKYDLSDIGNDIGIVLSKYIDTSKEGFELNDFNSGIKHGISLMDGTH